ncbi:unnamed protein product, partial [Iphiclides podalirius]
MNKPLTVESVLTSRAPIPHLLSNRGPHMNELVRAHSQRSMTVKFALAGKSAVVSQDAVNLASWKRLQAAMPQIALHKRCRKCSMSSSQHAK